MEEINTLPQEILPPILSPDKIDLVVNAVEARDVRQIIEEASQELWELAEPSNEEVKSAEYLKKLLIEKGFTIVVNRVEHIDTAFVAEYKNGTGDGDPVLGILLEYDALEGLGNEAEPCKNQRKNREGHDFGHGCGHNLIGSGALGAALALKNLMQNDRTLVGTLKVYGCAAEESGGAKVYMVRQDLFKDVDIVIHCHPLDMAMVANLRTAAVNRMEIKFFGKTSHAGLTPWLGRSAVDAAELFAHSINLMREHIETTARVQYIYEEAGKVVNVVPDYAKILLTVRDCDRERVNKTTEWIKSAAKGAAIATQCDISNPKTEGYEAKVVFGMYDLLPNTPLAKQMLHYLKEIGIPKWTDEEKEFAHAIRENMELSPKSEPLATKVEESLEELTMGGSSDVGDVSWNVPTMGITMPTVPKGVGMHTWAATACHGHTIGKNGAVAMAKVLAVMGYDVLTNPQLREKALENFEKRTIDAGIKYESPLPPVEKSTLPGKWILKDACSEMFTPL